MSFPEHALMMGLVLLLGSAATAADLPPEEPKESGSLLLAGRLPFGASGLPTGELLAPCEDQTIAVLDGQARALARWSAPGRFSGPVTVAPRGPTQLLAAPLVSGRVEVLAWDSKTRVLAGSFSFEHHAEATATAWAASGTVHGAWRDGRIEAWSSQGSLLWAAFAGFEVRLLLVDDSLGVYAIGPGHVVLFDFRGSEAGRWDLAGSPRGVLQTLAGNLLIWTDTGLWLKGIDATGFVLFDRSPRILGVVVDRIGSLLLTEPDRLRRVSPGGTLLSVAVFPRKAVTASTLDDRGRVLVGTTGGMETWTYDGRLLETLGTAPPVSSAVLTSQGLVAWSDEDWKLHVWTGFLEPPFGWSQDGGGPGRPFTSRRPSSVAARVVSWADDPDFGYFYQLAASGEEAKQREVLERFEAKASQGSLLEALPFANLILLKVGRSGLTDLQIDRFRILNNWPGLRLRAFALLSRTAGPEDRDEMISLLQKEFDPSVVAQGVQALARSGWDGDGKLMRLVFELQSRMPDQGVVADAVIDAARTLWTANGRSADPVLVPLVSAVYQGPFSRSVKQKAQKFFQDLMESP